MNKIENTDEVYSSIAVLVLAAGQSKRLGQPKQLVHYQGETLIVKQCQLALSVCENVYCVLGCQRDSLAEQIIHLPINIIHHDQWITGMGSSISAGVAALEKNYKGVLVLLVDQWRIKQDDLNQLISVFKSNSDSIIQSEFNIGTNEAEINKEYSMKYGPPIIFPQRFFPLLRGLSGEQGAKTIVQKYASSTIKVWLPNAGIDLDTPEQLNQMINSSVLHQEG